MTAVTYPCQKASTYRASPSRRVAGSARDRPDAQWEVVDGDDALARCSLWWTNTPAYGRHRAGLIGHYSAANDSAAALLLEHACRQLADNGCTIAIGPLDGNTWRGYRFVTDRRGGPPFFLEPCNPPEWPAQFARHGFEPLAGYFSALNDDLTRTCPRVQRVEKRITGRGIRVRCMRPDRIVEDLRQIYSVATRSFQKNLLYSQLEEADFLAQYQPLCGVVPLELILLAEREGRAVGFGFAVPDLLQRERGATIDTVVVKTLGVLPGREFAGLGQLLLERLHRRAHELGFRRAIHALVRDAGHLQRISARYAAPFRRYTLFARNLHG